MKSLLKKEKKQGDSDSKKNKKVRFILSPSYQSDEDKISFVKRLKMERN